MSDLISYKSNINPKVAAIVGIAIKSKAEKKEDGRETSREDTRECMNNIRRAQETSLEEVDQELTRKNEQAKIRERRNRDWSFEGLEI